jgi:putative heme-binding domain-containing protein
MLFRRVGWIVVGCLIAAAAPVLAEDRAAADVDSLVTLLELVLDADPDSARQCLVTLAEKVRGGEVDEKTSAELKERLTEQLGKLVADKENPLAADAALLAALWRQPAALAVVRTMAEHADTPRDRRRLALETLIVANDPAALKTAEKLLTGTAEDAADTQSAALAALSRLDDPAAADVVLAAYPQLATNVQPQGIELLTQRTSWSQRLVDQIAAEKIPATALNVNQVRKLLSLGDEELTKAVARHWGTIREGRDPTREQLIREMRTLLSQTPGDPHRGVAVFHRVCGQCHKIHGEGQEVGPDITANGRASYDQLLSNVFDPSLVIGASYQAMTVRTADGRVVTGLVAEDSDQRVVLKVQGGKTETIARDDVDAMKVSELSLMPEGLEKQLQPQEIADLFAFITLDKHPDDPAAQPIPGAGSQRRP